MTHRVITGLQWARLCDRPAGIPVTRPRGAKGRGLSYERALARAMPRCQHGQWYEFRDANGIGHCQTDLVQHTQFMVAVFEAKYTWVPEGHLQISQLYRPVLEMVYGRPVVGVVVCKVLMPGMPRVVRVTATVADALAFAFGGAPCVLHWLGKGSLGPSRGNSQSRPLGVAQLPSLSMIDL